MFKRAFLTQGGAPFLLFFAAVLCISAAPQSFAQTTSNLTKVDKIRDLISRRHEMDSVLGGFEQSIPTIVDAYKKQNPNLTMPQTEEMLAIIRNTVADLKPSLEKMLIDIYISQYSDEQIDSLYAFYTTPVGSQIAEKEGAVKMAAGLQGKTWGMTVLFPEITKRFQSDEVLRGLNLH